MAFLVCLFKLSLAKATNMKRKAVFVSVLQIQSTGEQRYDGYTAKKGLRIFTSMRDYLATEEESFLSLMFQSYCNFTIAFINTRYVLLPHRTPPPPPLQVPWQPQPRQNSQGKPDMFPQSPRWKLNDLVTIPLSLSYLLLILLLQAYILRILEHEEPELISGKQEKCEAIVNFFV